MLKTIIIIAISTNIVILVMSFNDSFYAYISSIIKTARIKITDIKQAMLQADTSSKFLQLI